MRINGPYSEKTLHEISDGATRQNLSHWRKTGLLPPWRKGPLRGYGYTDILSAKVIIKFKKAGISVRSIKK
jgi:DNA-binding transcriptional MerR regulator